MDGRNKNGGKRKNAGRKSKEETDKLIDNLDRLIDADEVILMLYNKVKEGNLKAIQLFLEYRYGKPKQISEVVYKDIPTFNLKDVLAFT